MSKYVITYAHNGFGREEARRVSKVWDIPFVDRNKRSISTICEEESVIACLVMTKTGPMIVTASGKKHRFHLSMAELRMLRIRRGESDHLLEAVGCDVNSVLDATCGLGADSAVLSFGLQIPITSLEASLPLAVVTNYGFHHAIHKEADVQEALRRVHVIPTSYEQYLTGVRDKSVDVIYFDAMFEMPIQESSQFDPLREIVVADGLSERGFQEALRVAKKRIVIKERKGAPIFEKLGVQQFIGGKYSRICYGMIEC